MPGSLLSLVFPRACIGCDRDGFLLCADCGQSVGQSQTIQIGELRAVAALPYAELLKDAIVEFKRGRRAFASDLAALVERFVTPDVTLVPIRTTRKRRAERGFDQTVLLANILQRRCGVGVLDVLTRHGNIAQHGRSRSERLASTGRFAARSGSVASRGRLVLFDDVRTTGATLLDAAEALREAGFGVTSALTLAWTPKE